MGAAGTQFRTLDPPPPREARRVEAGMPTKGQRVVCLRPEGHMRDVRAASDPFDGEDGRLYIRVVTEAAWYRWALIGVEPDVQTWPAYLVFVE